MKRSEAARYARWSVTIAAVLAAATLAVYLKREVVKFRDIRNAPAAAPTNVERQSNGLTFSKVEGTRTIFTVTAGKSTEFKDKGANLLEDVRIVIFGKTGERHDTIHTRSCQYGKEDGSVVCSGDVQIDMQSAADVARLAETPNATPAQIVHVATQGVTFDRATGAAHTAEPVRFTFPGGQGSAVGVEYNSAEGTARLLHDVNFTLQQAAGLRGKNQKPAALPADDVHVRGSALDFARDAHLLHLFGPAQAETKSALLNAGEISLELNAAFQAQQIHAVPGPGGQQPALTTLGPGNASTLAADHLAARFAPQGGVEQLTADGHVHGTQHGAVEQHDFSADQASMDVWPQHSEPRQLDLTGNVLVKTKANQGSDTRVLQTTALRMEFSGGTEGPTNKPRKAETFGPGAVEWTDTSSAKGTQPARTKLTADKMELAFGPGGKASSLLAIGNVRTERVTPSQTTQSATANQGTMQLVASGGWSHLNLQGNVHLNEADRRAQAGHAVFDRAAQLVTLTDQAVVRDSTTETRAARITFSQATGDIHAEGGVRSADFSAKGSTVQLASAPSNITADNLQANSKTGRALYSGQARLWQGDSVMEADSIELLRDKKVLIATGNVRAVLPQAPASPKSALAAAPFPGKKPNLWHLSAETLNYSDVQSLAHLEKNVVVQSADQRIRAAAMDLYFSRGVAATDGAVPSAGAQQISKAIGSGGVTVQEGLRKATADRGIYTAADGKFVMSGGHPTLADGSAGTTTGRQLTFFLADDTIIVDSENGSRTLTKHRVDK